MAELPAAPSGVRTTVEPSRKGQIPQSLCVRLELAMIFAALSDPPRQDPPDGVATWTRSARRPPHRRLTVSTTRSTKTPTVSAAILIASM